MLPQSLSNNNYTVQRACCWKVFDVFFTLFAHRGALEVEWSAKGGRMRRKLNTANCPATKPRHAGIPKASSINSNHNLAS